MPDNSPDFSVRLLQTPGANNAHALTRISLAKRRIQLVLDRETIAHQKTLEQKISEQGPKPQRVDPHLVGWAVMDLLELNRLRRHAHPSTGTKPWYANPATSQDRIAERLNELAPLYSSVSGHGFGNLTGDALEVIVYKCLDKIYGENRRYSYLGHFELTEPKNNQGRYRKIQPPKTLGGRRTQKEADFLQFGHHAEPLCIECKNYREWIYPHHEVINDLIIKAAELNAIPILIARRLHYTTRTNLLEPAGIIAHETYFQYYPADKAELAAKVKHKRSLGFTDVTASENPHPRTEKFFAKTLPKIVERMSERWFSNMNSLVEYALGLTNLAQLYNAIESPAAGNWQDFQAPDQSEFDSE